MTTTYATPPGTISCAPISADDPLLTKWVDKLFEQSPQFRHVSPSQRAKNWLGLYSDGGTRLLCAVGYIFLWNGDVFVQAAVCRPNKAGRVALTALLLLCRREWAGRRCLWETAVPNRKFNRIALALGAHASAIQWEVVA